MKKALIVLLCCIITLIFCICVGAENGMCDSLNISSNLKSQITDKNKDGPIIDYTGFWDYSIFFYLGQSDNSLSSLEELPLTHVISKHLFTSPEYTIWDINDKGIISRSVLQRQDIIDCALHLKQMLNSQNIFKDKNTRITSARIFVDSVFIKTNNGDYVLYRYTTEETSGVITVLAPADEYCMAVKEIFEKRDLSNIEIIDSIGYPTDESLDILLKYRIDIGTNSIPTFELIIIITIATVSIVTLLTFTLIIISKKKKKNNRSQNG